MLKITSILVLLSAALTLTESRVQMHRGLTSSPPLGSHPYVYLRSPNGDQQSVNMQAAHGFTLAQSHQQQHEASMSDEEANASDEQMSDDDDHDADEHISQRASALVHANDRDDFDQDDYDDSNDTNNNDDDDDDNNDRYVAADDDNNGDDGDDDDFSVVKRTSFALRNTKPNQMLISRDKAGAIMVPEGLIEIEGQSVVDPKTGRAALLVPRAALDAIPNGSVVALMERSADETEEERANRVIVRRRRKGSRRNVRRRRGGNRRGYVVRPQVTKRTKVRVIRPTNTRNRRRVIRGGNRQTPIYVQG